MIRVIVRETDATLVAHAGAREPEVRYRTFEFEAPELERFLEAEISSVLRSVVGVEILEASS